MVEYQLAAFILQAKLRELAEQVVVVMDQQDQQMQHLDLQTQVVEAVVLDFFQLMVLREQVAQVL